jgi:uncharacterized protein YxeA
MVMKATFITLIVMIIIIVAAAVFLYMESYNQARFKSKQLIELSKGL